MSISSISEFKIECKHTTDGVSIDVTLRDYYPLTKREITELLIFAAKKCRDAYIVSNVQVRFVQGIVGMTCPRPVEGDVAERLNALNNLYIKRYTEGGAPDLIDKLYAIMTR